MSYSIISVVKILIEFLTTAKLENTTHCETVALVLRDYLSSVGFINDDILLIFEAFVEIAFEEDDNKRSTMLSIVLGSSRLIALQKYRVVINAAISSY
jgi:hypothetical protein